jgi:hypothetical protein
MSAAIEVGLACIYSNPTQQEIGTQKRVKIAPEIVMLIKVISRTAR